jgi:hypothetical protein
MTPFDYISVLLSIVISIALAHILTGIARMIRSGVVRFSIPLAQWIGFCLFLCVDYWFYIWRLNDQLDWSLTYVGQLLIQASLIYLASHLIVPSSSGDGPMDMTDFFDRNRRKFMSIVIILAITNEILNLSLPGFGSLHVGLLVAAWIALLSIGIYSNSPKVQLVLAATNVLLTVHYAVEFVPAL